MVETDHFSRRHVHVHVVVDRTARKYYPRRICISGQAKAVPVYVGDGTGHVGILHEATSVDDASRLPSSYMNQRWLSLPLIYANRRHLPLPMSTKWLQTLRVGE